MIYRIVLNALCIVLVIIMSVAIQGKKWSTALRRHAFMRIFGLNVLLCAADIVAGVFTRPEDPLSVTIYTATLSVYYAFVVWCAFCWALYVVLRVLNRRLNSGTSVVLSFPALLATFVLLAQPFSMELYRAAENGGYERSGFYYVFWCCVLAYFIAGAVYLLFLTFTVRSRIDRRNIVRIFLFSLPFAGGVAAQIVLPELLMVHVGLLLSGLMVVFDHLRERITRDALTGLNNRSAFEYYVAETLRNSPHEFCIVMFDIDDFKKINDTYGHQAGDTALQRFSALLAAIGCDSTVPAFICRYGGDEFLLCSDGVPDESVEEMLKDLKMRLAKANAADPESRVLSVSAGKARGVCATFADAEKLINLADAAMYEQKQAKKIGR